MVGGYFNLSDRHKMATGSGGVKSPVRSPKKQWDASAVAKDDYLASVARRLDLMEKRVLGKRGLREGYPPLYPSVKASQQLASQLAVPSCLR